MIKLEEIQHHWTHPDGFTIDKEVEWLINRVKKLEEALDYIEGNCEFGMDGECNPRCDACVARKALKAETEDS